MSLVSSHCGWQPLREVWLGDTYPMSYYDHLSSAVREGFQIITEWTKEDTLKIENKLQELGVKVVRPVYPAIDHCIDDRGNLLKPTIAATDDNIVLGDTLYCLRNQFKTSPWKHAIDQYRASGSTVHEINDGPWSTISPPCMVRIGQDLYIDYIYHEHVFGVVSEVLVDLAKKYRVHISMFDGHSDCVFSPVREGLILTTKWKNNYQNTFPDWEIYQIDNSNITKPLNMSSSGNQWHVPSKDLSNNKEFQQYIQDHASTWTGSFQETIFDVNLLIVDDKNILTVGENPAVCDFLSNKGFSVHQFDFRCKNFWDSGMHCLTNDIRRDGECPDLYPNLPKAYLDWVYDN